ncbi:MAG: efflux RND transporter permease subunit [Planctomycetales bacterium]|nr:efflux RND transporter permease subunit [Planctomycetales bacterium]
MKISRHAIDHPRIVYVVTSLVLLLSLAAVLRIPIQRTPAISKAVILVAVPHPGALPSEVEEQITRKIEEKLERLKDVDFIASSSLRGSSITQIIFMDGVDPKQARGEVKDLVDEVRGELPRGRDIEPTVTEIDFENTPLMLVNMIAPEGYDERSLKLLAEEVQEDLADVEGVASTQLFGGREREIHVNLHVDHALEHGISIADVRSALAEYHSELPGGALETGNFDFQVRSATKFRGVEDVRQTVVKEVQGRVIRVADVADVRDTYRRLKNVARIDGKNCATIIIYKESDINTLASAMALKRRVDELRSQYPQVEFSVTRDTSEEIAIMFRVLGSSFVFGAMLVLVILGWSMGLRISTLVLLAIPFSSGIGLIFLYSLGVPLSNMVIFSFILALGMVVDGAIIVAENIHRHIERGLPPADAAKIGIEEVGMPVIMADLTTIAAFLPMLLVPGIMGDFMRMMPIVVSVSLFGSIMVDHFLIPVLAAKWFSQRVPAAGVPEPDEYAAEGDGTVLHTNWLTRPYLAALRWSLNHRWAVLASSLLALIWAGSMFFRIGFEFFPGSDRGQFEVKYELPLGNSIEQTIEAAKVITEPLDAMLRRQGGEVVHYVSAIGSSEGLASRLENDPAVGPEFGTIMVQLRSPLDRRIHEDTIIRRLREQIEERLPRVPGMTYSIKKVEEGPPGGHDVAIRLTGDNVKQLGELGKSLSDGMAAIAGTVDNGTDYRPESPEVVVDPDPAILPLRGLTKTQISSAVQTAIHGDTTIEISMEDEDVVVRLQADAPYRRSAESLRRLVIVGKDGQRATVGEVSDVRRSLGTFAVNRYERKRAVVAKCNVNSPLRPDDVFRRVREVILPSLGFEPVPGSNVAFLGKPGSSAEGARATFTGENEERDKNFVYLLWCMIIAVVLIFAILVLQFNSFRQPVIVLMTVPMSFIGVVLGMWACGFPFSLATFIGLVSLSGIVVNDAIVVVDFVNQARRRGHSLHNAVLEAGVTRLRPVLLTTLTTVGGLLPLFLNLSGGAEFWQPLTGAIVFGLSFATILTLLVIPVLLTLTYDGPLGHVIGFFSRLFFVPAPARERGN